MTGINVDWKTAAVGAGLIIAAYYILRHDAKKIVATTVDAIDPTNRENVFYEGASKVTGKPFGVWVYELIHGDQ